MSLTATHARVHDGNTITSPTSELLPCGRVSSLMAYFVKTQNRQGLFMLNYLVIDKVSQRLLLFTSHC